MNTAVSSDPCGADCPICLEGGCALGRKRNEANALLRLIAALSLCERENRWSLGGIADTRGLGVLRGFVFGLLVGVLCSAAGFAQPVSYFSYDGSGNLTNIQ